MLKPLHNSLHDNLQTSPTMRLWVEHRGRGCGAPSQSEGLYWGVCCSVFLLSNFIEILIIVRVVNVPGLYVCHPRK